MRAGIVVEVTPEDRVRLERIVGDRNTPENHSARSRDPDDMPLVSPNLLKDPRDAREMIAGQRFFLRAFKASPLADRIARVAIPDPDDPSEEALMQHCRRFVKTNYHPSGTCRMGPDGDRTAVLDSRLRVRGVDKLRVCDLSAMPNINAGNTNAPAMMFGSRCAEFIASEPKP